MPDLTYTIDIGDFLAVAPTIPTGSIDHIITDPMYLAHTHENFRSGGGAGKKRGTKAVSTGRPISYGALTLAQRAECAHEMRRIARRWVITFCDIEGVSGWKDDQEAAGLEYIRTGVWVRGEEDLDPVTHTKAVRGDKGAPQFTGDRPAAGHEAIVMSHAPGTRIRWNGRGARVDGTGGSTGGGAVYFANIVKQGRVVRVDGSTQDAPKPLDLMTTLVQEFTDPGDSILDLFCGSGTTILAAKNTGRSARGIEINPAAAAAARVRCGL